MPTFEITAPDGRKFRVTGPEGSTREEALARVKASYKPAAPEASGSETDTGFAESKLGAAAYGAVTGIPGGKAVAAGMRTALGKGVELLGGGPAKDYAQNREDIEREAVAAFSDEPLVSGAATLGIGAATGGALMRGAAALPGVGRAIAAGARPVLQAGRPVANAAQLAKAGAVTGGVFGAASGAVEGAVPGLADMDAAEAAGGALAGAAREGAAGAAIGAAAGPVVGAVAGAVAPLVKRGAAALRDRAAMVASPDTRSAAPSVAQRIAGRTTALDSWVNIASKRLKVSPAELKRAVLDYRDSTGKMPSTAQVLEIASLRNMADVSMTRTAAADTFRAAAARGARELPRDLASQITRGGVTPTTQQVAQAAAKANKAAMDPIRDVRISLPEDLPPRLRRLIATEVSADSDRRASALLEDRLATADTLDRVYQRLSALHEREPGHGYDALRAQLRDLVTAQEPRYAAVRGTFERTAKAKAGFKAGLENMTGDEAASVAQGQSLADPVSLRTQQAGTRRRLLTQATESEAGARRTARQLAEPTSAAAMTPALSAAERSRLTAAAERLSKGQEALESLVPSSSKSEAAEQARDIGEAIKSALVFGSQSTTLFKANMLTQLATRLRISDATARKLAEAITDPAQTEKVIDLLRRARVNEAEIRDIVARSARAAGVGSGEAAQAVGQ